MGLVVGRSGRMVGCMLGRVGSNMMEAGERNSIMSCIYYCGSSCFHLKLKFHPLFGAL